MAVHILSPLLRDNTTSQSDQIVGVTGVWQLDSDVLLVIDGDAFRLSLEEAPQPISPSLAVDRRPHL